MARKVEFQKRHFEFLADTLRESGASKEVIEYFANALGVTNPQFQREKFTVRATKLPPPVLPIEKYDSDCRPGWEISKQSARPEFLKSMDRLVRTRRRQIKAAQKAR